MKNIIKKISSFIVASLLMILFVSTIDYVSAKTTYIPTNEICSLEVGNLKFSNVSFKKNKSQYGITGLISNKSDNPISYTVYVSCYDRSRTPLEKKSVETVKAGTSDFNHMFNLELEDKLNIEDIYMYSVYVKVHDYTINKYDVNINVNENNTFDVTETITVHFNEPKYGITREIPLKNSVDTGETTFDKLLKISNISVDNKYTTTQSNDTLKIEMGDKKNKVFGDQTYVLKYTCDMGADVIKTYDELCYNIIDNEWKTTISNATFKITMPKEFDTSQLSFSAWEHAKDKDNNIKYEVNGNTITGRYDGVLPDWKGLSVKCKLPEGYFVRSSSLYYCMLIVPILGLLITLLFWLKSSKGKKTIEFARFYPPRGLNSLEVGFLYRGKATTKDVTSLLFYLANKGYIKICESEDSGSLSRASDIKILKLKEYDGDNENEKMFLEGLFEDKSAASFKDAYKFIDQEKQKDKKINYEVANKRVNENAKSSSKTSVILKDLNYKFYVTTNAILSNINKKTNRNKVIKKNSWIRSIIVRCLIAISIISMFVILAIPPMEYCAGALPKQSYGFAVLTIITFSILVFCICRFKVLSIPFALKIVGLAMVSLGLIVTLLLPWSFEEIKVMSNMYLLGFIIDILCVVGMIILSKKIQKRTEYGNEMLGKLKEFRKFLKTAEKEKLENIVVQNPTYFYDILPYAYALDVSDIWIKKFEVISLNAPSWYDGPSDDSTDLLGENIRSMMSLAQRIMAVDPEVWRRFFRLLLLKSVLSWRK